MFWRSACFPFGLNKSGIILHLGCQVKAINSNELPVRTENPSELRVLRCRINSCRNNDWWESACRTKRALSWSVAPLAPVFSQGSAFYASLPISYTFSDFINGQHKQVHSCLIYMFCPQGCSSVTIFCSVPHCRVVWMSRSFFVWTNMLHFPLPVSQRDVSL